MIPMFTFCMYILFSLSLLPLKILPLNFLQSGVVFTVWTVSLERIFRKHLEQTRFGKFKQNFLASLMGLNKAGVPSGLEPEPKRR